MEERPAATMHAQQGFEFADVFAYKFEGRNIGSPPRHLVLRAPDGPSTAGGKQARQSLVLQNDAGDALVCGWVNLSERTAEVRSHAYLREQFLQRKGFPIDVPQAEYEALVKEVAAFLRVNRLDVQRVEQPPEGRVETDAAAGGGLPLWLILGLSVLAGLALGYVLFG
jgi:translation initiation factor IF-2